MHFTKKLLSTVWMLWRLGCARTRGQYVHSVHGFDFSYAVYRWRGVAWAFPTTHIEGEF